MKTVYPLPQLCPQVGVMENAWARDSSRLSSSPSTTTFCWVMRNKLLLSVHYIWLSPLPSKADSGRQLGPVVGDVGSVTGWLSLSLHNPVFYSRKWG